MTRGLERATMFGAVAGFAGAASGAVIGTGGHFGAVVAVGLLALACLGVRLRLAGVRPPARMRGPRTQKVGAAAFGVLLVGSLVVGSVGAPVGAANAETAECSSIDRLLSNFLGDEVICAEDSDTAQVIEDAQEQNAIEDEQTLTDLKQLAAGQHQKTQEATAIRKNYLNDAETVAWSKGEAAMAEALENETDVNGDGNFTAADARLAGIEAMADYWAQVHQVPMAESWNATMASARYIDRVAVTEDGLSSALVGMDTGDDWHYDNTTTTNVTLVNGTTVSANAWTLGNHSGTVDTGALETLAGLLEDFEGQMPSDGWTAATNYTLEGDQSGYLDGSVSRANGAVTVSNESYDSMTIPVRLENLASDGFAYGAPSTSGGSVAQINFEPSGSATFIGGTDTVTYDNVWSEGTWVQQKFVFDWANSTLEMKLLDADGNVVFDPNREWDMMNNPDGYATSVQFTSDAELWSDRIAANGTVSYSSLRVDEVIGDGEKQTIVEFEDYGEVWNSIESTNARLEDNFEVYANETYSAWENGTVNATDYVSSTTLMQEYATDYNSSGYYTYAVAALSQAGLSAPSISNTSHMELRYTPAGTNTTAVNLTGMLMSQDGPIYGPNETAADGTDLVNGTWYSNRTYATENVSGNELFIGVDGTQQTLNGTFVVEGIYNRDGNRTGSAAVETYNYKSQSADDFVNQTEQRAEFRAMLESLEPELSGYAWNSRGGGWGLGGLLSNGPTALLIGLVAALLILRN